MIRGEKQRMMASLEYMQAEARGDAATMGRLMMEAEIEGISQYNASEGALLKAESERALVEAVRNDASVKEEYWNAGLLWGKVLDEGIAAARFQNGELGPQLMKTMDGPSGLGALNDRYMRQTPPSQSQKKGQPSSGSSRLGPLNDRYLNYRSEYMAGYSTGLDRVPYDNYPALLHRDERVLTAAEANSQRSGGTGDVIIQMGGVTIREDADIDKVASAIVEKIALNRGRG